MDPEKLLRDWRDRHSPGIPVRQSTITCGLPSVLFGEPSVPKPCCSQHTTLEDVINHSCECVSRLKVRASLFILWYMYKTLENHIEPPILNTKLFTQAFAAVRGDAKAVLREEYTNYKREVGITSSDVKQVDHISQILEHTKNEMLTVYKNCVALNFTRRCRSCIRWEIYDIMKDDTTFRRMKKGRNEKVAKLADQCLNCVVKDQDLSVIDDFSDVFSSDCLDGVKKMVQQHHEQLAMILCGAKEKVQKRKNEKRQTAIDRGLIKPAENVDPDAKPSKKKQHNANKQPLDQVLSILPHLVLPYQYWARKRLDDLALTQQYTIVSIRARFCVDKDERTKMWKSEWFWGKDVSLPQFKLLPIFHTKKHFIRIDAKQLDQWGMNENQEQNDDQKKWWCTHVFDIYSKRANIRPLRRYADIGSPKNVVELMNLISTTDSDKLGPYIPGCSIQTDGLQIKVPVLSLRHVTPNLHRLFERGYTGIPQKPNLKADISVQTRGIYRVSGCLPLDPDSERPITAIDPGRKKVLCCCTSTISDIYNNKDQTCQDIKDHASFSISNEEYHEQTGSIKFQQYEQGRRKVNTEYQDSIEGMSGVTHKTCNIRQISDYIHTKLRYEKIREDELYRSDRRGHHFYVFKRQQRAISNFVSRILGGRKDMIVLFGDGTFSPGGASYAAVPKKKFLRQFAQYAVVILVCEHNTSKLCPKCYTSG